MSWRGPFLTPHDLTKVIQTKSLQWIYENASDMIKSEREVPIVYGMFDGPWTEVVKIWTITLNWIICMVFRICLHTYNDEHYFIFWTKISRTKAIRKYFFLCLDSIVWRFVLCLGLLRNNGGYKFLGLFRPGVRMSLQIRLIIIHCNL